MADSNLQRFFKKILLIDNNESIFLALKKLENIVESVSLTWAQDGEEGIQLATKEKPDLVITSINMPKINGFEVIKRLKETKETEKTNIVILSKFGGEHVTDKDFLEALGIKKYLVKSNYSDEDLTKEIKSVLI